MSLLADYNKKSLRDQVSKVSQFKRTNLVDRQLYASAHFDTSASSGEPGS